MENRCEGPYSGEFQPLRQNYDRLGHDMNDQAGQTVAAMNSRRVTFLCRQGLDQRNQRESSRLNSRPSCPYGSLYFTGAR